MKSLHLPLVFCLALVSAALVSAARPPAGPKGGRILTPDAPHAEFFVEKDRKVLIAFYDSGLKPLAPGDRVVSAVVETKPDRVKLDFEKTSAGFHSKQPLPEGNGYTVVVQIRESVAGRPANYRVVFNDEECAGCRRAEYACTCDEGDGEPRR